MYGNDNNQTSRILGRDPNSGYGVRIFIEGSNKEEVSDYGNIKCDVEGDEEQETESKMTKAIKDARKSEDRIRRILMALLAKLKMAGSSEEEMEGSTKNPAVVPNKDDNIAMADQAIVRETSIPTSKDRIPSELIMGHEKSPDQHTGGEERAAGTNGNDLSDPG